MLTNKRFRLEFPVSNYPSACIKSIIHSQDLWMMYFAHSLKVRSGVFKATQKHNVACGNPDLFFSNCTNNTKNPQPKHQKNQKWKKFYGKSRKDQSHQSNKKSPHPQTCRFLNKTIQLIRTHLIPLEKLFWAYTFGLLTLKGSVNKCIPQNDKAHKTSKKAHKLNAPNTQSPRYESCCDDSQPQRNQKDTCSVVEIGKASLFTSSPRGHFQFSGAFFLTHVRSLLSLKFNSSSYHASYEFSTKGAR